jgi:hypothetical protein
MYKVRVKEGMPDGFFGFYNDSKGAGQRRRCGFEGAAGDEFELVDLMAGPERKRVVSVKAIDTFSEKWMEFWDGSEWVERITEKRKPGPKKKVIDDDLTEH